MPQIILYIGSGWATLLNGKVTISFYLSIFREPTVLIVSLPQLGRSRSANEKKGGTFKRFHVDGGSFFITSCFRFITT